MTETRQFVDRLLESENLTDELEDDDANWLLNWGIAQIEIVVEGQPDPEAAAKKVNALMRFMRLLNRIGGKPASFSSGRIPELLEGHSAAFGSSRAPSEADCRQVVDSLPAMTPRQAIEFLIKWTGSH